jgi:anthranilate synthase component 2
LKLLVLDNYDSFTYNLVHLLEKISGVKPIVAKNNKIDLSDIENFDKILLSPGPGLPSEAGIMPELLNKYHSTKDIFGVCLGLQGVAETFGCRLRNLDHVVHGMATDIIIQKENPLFYGCPQKFKAGRYHSWVIDNQTVDHSLEIIAVDEKNDIMAMSHKQFKVCGVQFHPESILSEYGERILTNWLSLPV